MSGNFSRQKRTAAIIAAMMCSVILVFTAAYNTSANQQESITPENTIADNELLAEAPDTAAAEHGTEEKPPISQEQAPDELFIFREIDTGYAVSKYIGTATDTVIPESYNGLPVVLIDDLAFQYCSSLVSVEIPASIESIGKYAFSHCFNLASVTLSEGIAFFHTFLQKRKSPQNRGLFMQIRPCRVRHGTKHRQAIPKSLNLCRSEARIPAPDAFLRQSSQEITQ